MTFDAASVCQFETLNESLSFGRSRFVRLEVEAPRVDCWQNIVSVGTVAAVGLSAGIGVATTWSADGHYFLRGSKWFWTQNLTDLC